MRLCPSLQESVRRWLRRPSAISIVITRSFFPRALQPRDPTNRSRLGSEPMRQASRSAISLTQVNGAPSTRAGLDACATSQTAHHDGATGFWERTGEILSSAACSAAQRSCTQSRSNDVSSLRQGLRSWAGKHQPAVTVFRIPDFFRSLETEEKRAAARLEQTAALDRSKAEGDH